MGNRLSAVAASMRRSAVAVALTAAVAFAVPAIYAVAAPAARVDVDIAKFLFTQKEITVAPGTTAPPDAKVDPKAGAALKGGATATPAGPQVEAPLPRVDFGSDDDFQLQQAMNHLKGAPVIAKAKSVSAQAKPQ